jgi:hypothetical protein
MRSKFTIVEIEETAGEYQKMLDDAITAGNTRSIDYLTSIVEDLQGCVKYATDWYNEGESEDADENEPRDAEEAGQDISSTSGEHS